MTATCHEKFKRDHLYIEGGLVLKPRWADPEKCLLDEILPTTDLAKPLGRTEWLAVYLALDALMLRRLLKVGILGAREIS